MHLGDDTIHYPIIGCDKLFSNEDLYTSQILRSNLYDFHVEIHTTTMAQKGKHFEWKNHLVSVLDRIGNLLYIFLT